MRNLETWLAFALLSFFMLTFHYCGYNETRVQQKTKQTVEAVYKDDGLTIDYVVIGGVEHQILPTASMDLLLDSLETKDRQLKLREEQITSYQKISDRQKADLQMCHSDRKQAYGHLDMCLAREIPFYQTNEFSFLGGYVACAASYAIWNATR